VGDKTYGSELQPALRAREKHRRSRMEQKRGTLHRIKVSENPLSPFLVAVGFELRVLDLLGKGLTI
jgi:hypothetical protein